MGNKTHIRDMNIVKGDHIVLPSGQSHWAGGGGGGTVCAQVGK